MRGGIGGQGLRGGFGAIDSQNVGSVSFLGFAPRDQGGANVASQTRWQIAGLTSIAGPNLPIVANTVNLLQGNATGEMLYLVPHYFEEATRITALGMRTNGTILANGNPRCRIGVWSLGTLASGTLAGSRYAGNRLGQSAVLALLPGADRVLETTDLNIVVAALTRVWFGCVFDAQSAANQHTIEAVRRNCLYPIHGFPLDTANSVAQDVLKFSVGFRHAFSFSGTEDLPDPAPQSAPVLLDAGAAADTANVPAIRFRSVPA